MRVDELDTPIPVIDLDRVERNLRELQEYCDRHRLKLRPHIKTHKLPAFAHRQIQLGAGGITCQKLGEAEVMASAGIDDILISYPLIGPVKAQRLADLARRVGTLRVAADSAAAIETIAAAATAAGRPIGVLVEFDSGAKRTGVTSVEAALALAVQARDARLRFDGLMTYPSSAASADFLAAALPRFAAKGLEIAIMSGGGTPNAWHAHEIAGLTEVRVGTYIYHDRATIGAGAARLEDSALQIHATVISRPTDTRAVLDAGSKSLSSDRIDPAYGTGYGLILEYPDAVIERLNEEHGVVDLSACATRPAIGERVRIVPNHVCVVTNLHDEVAVGRAGELVGIWPVAARGKTR